MKKILIDARDFAFYWSTTQGNKAGGIDGKIKFGGFMIFYYQTLLFLVGNIQGYLGYKSSFKKDAPALVQIFEGFMLHSPILIITYIILKKLAPVPYNPEMLPHDIKRKRRVYIIGIILGFCL